MSPDLVRGSGGELYNKTLVVEVSKCEYKQHGGW